MDLLRCRTLRFAVHPSVLYSSQLHHQPQFPPLVTYLLVPLYRPLVLSIYSTSRSLSWKVHPPTSYCFTKHILFLLPYTSVSMDTRYEILEIARFLSELSVFDYFFVMQRPSSVGLASILNAMNAIPGVSSSAVEGMKAELVRIPGLDPDSDDVKECSKRLEMLYAQGGYSLPSAEAGEQRIETVSPVCVSHGVNPYESTYKESFEYSFPATE
jgi:Cyclin, C-terminal domain